jgi:hypothetical protein
MLFAVLEQAGLLGRADQMARQRSRLEPSSLIKLAKLRNRLLNDTATDPDAAHKTPIARFLAMRTGARCARAGQSGEGPRRDSRPGRGPRGPSVPAAGRSAYPRWPMAWLRLATSLCDLDLPRRALPTVLRRRCSVLPTTGRSCVRLRCSAAPRSAQLGHLVQVALQRRQKIRSEGL